MDFEELVSLRRSTRSYEPSEISYDEIYEIIACALEAPSWKNTETGRYYVALSKEEVEAVSEMLPDFNRESTQNACAYIVTAFKMGESGYNGGEATEEGELWGAYDLGLQNQLLILKAKELGYDSLIMGLRDVEALRGKFDIPDDEMIMAVICLGKAEGEPSRPKRKDVKDISVII